MTYMLKKESGGPKWNKDKFTWSKWKNCLNGGPKWNIGIGNKRWPKVKSIPNIKIGKASGFFFSSVLFFPPVFLFAIFSFIFFRPLFYLSPFYLFFAFLASFFPFSIHCFFTLLFSARGKDLFSYLPFFCRGGQTLVPPPYQSIYPCVPSSKNWFPYTPSSFFSWFFLLIRL